MVLSGQSQSSKIVRYTLICSASGTGLSSSLGRLATRTGDRVCVEDVEKNLCNKSRMWDELPVFGGVKSGRRSMAEVCGKLPRRAVSVYWREALSNSLSTLAAANQQQRSEPYPSLALACHLTLFTPHRREFFVPWTPQDFRTGTDGQVYDVARVIVLIDDIYDMYARLSGKGDVFNETQQSLNYSDWVKKLSGLSLPSELLKLEVRRRTLETLAAWRRAELVQAEALAAALGNVPLTILGVKHHVSVLERLVQNPEGRVVYLSHKITEARRYNRAHPGQWPTFVTEINALSAPMLEAGVVLLHPTAIDELRMTSSDHQVGLTDRWPLQDDSERLIYSKPGCYDPPGYKDLLGQYKFDGEGSVPEAEAVFRGFELSVFHEIATRDHLLVSSTEGLVLYRPVAENGKDSSGARAEVQHWSQRWAHEPPQSAPRLVALHTFEDIDLRLRELSSAQSLELQLRMLEALDKQGIEREAATALLAGDLPVSQHLVEIHGAEQSRGEMENAAGVALIQCFLNWLCNVRWSDGRLGATLVAAESAEALRSPEMIRLVAQLLDGAEDAMSTTATHIVAYSRSRNHKTLQDFAQSLMRRPQALEV
jgi:hypothetical protein